MQSGGSRTRGCRGKMVSRRAYFGAMKSNIANLLNVGGSSLAAASPPPLYHSPLPAFEIEEEENSYDMNDDMSDSMPEVGGDQEADHVLISDDGDSESAKGSVRKRGKKRPKGMKVGPKVSIQGRSSKVTSEIWNHSEKVPVPSPREKGVMVTMAQFLYCRRCFSYTQGGPTSHLGRHYKKSCSQYKIELAKKETQTLLNFQPSHAGASESTFSTGGRILDDYKNSLRPAMVEALVCASSWIREAQNDKRAPISMEQDDDDDVETIPFPKSVVESN